MFVSGSEDRIMPPGYAHLQPARKGWEQIADEVLDWAVQHAR